MEVNQEKREEWVDCVKVVACVLVVLGHFFQSMTKAGIIAEGTLWKWFDQMIYCFHVQLFFICSGYLYQRKNQIHRIDAWRRRILEKAVVLGIPYAVFSVITWGMKKVFSLDVNSEEAGLLRVLFVAPLSPYWYLYTLFLCFAVTPAIKRGSTIVFMPVIALVSKLFVVSGAATGIGVPYVLRNLLGNEIWFVAGMLLEVFSFKKIISHRRCIVAGGLGGTAFLLIGFAVFQTGGIGRWEQFFLGILACSSILMTAAGFCKKNGQESIWEIGRKYIFPIFLMHTIFAAGVRILLLKIGIDHAGVHVAAGVVISFLGPVAVMKVTERWMRFLVYPEIPGICLKKQEAGN